MKYYTLYLFVFIFGNPFYPSAQIIEPKITIVDQGQYKFSKIGKLPQVINEASGLQSIDKIHYWTHNDGGLPVLYCIDTLGNLIKSMHLVNKNRGWEDLAKDSEGNLYIGAFGNNSNKKKDLKILKIPPPDSVDNRRILADAIKYVYEDQFEFPPSPDKRNFDVDAFLCKGDSLFLFTKNRTDPYNGIINIYSLPTNPGEYVAKKVDSFKLPGSDIFSNWITGADISEDYNTIALLFHDKIILINNFSNNKFSSGDFYQINLNHYSHKAGICYSNLNEFLIVDELELGIVGGHLYQLQIYDRLNR